MERTRTGGAMAGLALAMLLASLGNSMPNVALPGLAVAFAAPFAAVQWVLLAYLLATTALVVGAGRLGDIAGQRRLLLAGIAAFCLGAALAALAPSLPLLLAARAVQGVGAAAMMALSLAMVGAAVPKAATGRAMGLLGTMSSLGTAAGPTLGGALLAWLGWRAMFLAMLPLGLAALVLVWRALPADRPAARPAFDLRGTVVLAASLACYALAMAARPAFDLRGTVVLAASLACYALAMTGWWPLLVAAALGAWLFLRVEAQAPAPLLRPAMMRADRLWASLATALLVSAVVMAALVVGPFHLSHALGLSAASVGLALSAGPAAAALAGIPAGRLVDRLGTRPAAVLGLAVMLAGTAALALALPGVAGYVAPLCVATAGYALFQAANNTAALSGLVPDRRGLVSGLLNLARNLGLVTGASAMGAVFALAAGAEPGLADAAAIARATRITFAAASGMVALALAIAFGGRRGR